MRPTVTSVISFCSSALIIYIMARSNRNRYTATYHRIMVFISIADMLSSSAISLTTIPMPKDVNEVYRFNGKSYGTVVTCEIQAFSHILGLWFSACASVFLSIYYLLTIRYRVPHRTIVTKYAEPSFLIITLMLSLTSIFKASIRKLYDPTPFASWCTRANFRTVAVRKMEG
jgi:hypothetical protein